MSSDKSGVSGWSAAVEEFLTLLARAVRQFHTYPETSSMCTEAIAACHRAFTSLERHDRLALRVTPHEFLADDAGIGGGGIIERELVQRLHKARVASLEFDHAASPRDFTRFCTDLLRSEDLAETKTTFAELLTEHGVDLIVPRMAHRPEVLDVGPRPDHVWDLVDRDRKRRSAAAPSGPAQYLYPPEKGWVRLESGGRSDSLSLVDLAVLVDDPSDVATMLLRLTDDDPVDEDARKRALEQKFGDVAMLFAALDGHLARLMFGKLAQAVLTIPHDRRKALLQRTILPGLLDGRAAGAVLRDFPDSDLAESLCLLLELETAAPEVVTAALQRLDLPAERSQAIASLVDERLRQPMTAAGGESRDEKIDRFARRLIRIDATVKKDFSEFSAFDLSIDDQAAAAIAAVGPTIVATDMLAEQIDCLWRLVRLEPNPTLVESFLTRTAAHLAELDRANRIEDLQRYVRRFKELADTLADNRPDVAETIGRGLRAFCTAARAARWIGLGKTGGDDTLEPAMIDAFGELMAPSFVELLDDAALQPRSRALTTLLCEHAEVLAPGLIARLGRSGSTATRAIVRVCGYAGAGYEVAVSEQVNSRDEQTVREAFRSLARIGTPRAAAIVAAQIQNGTPAARTAAEEALWHLPPALTTAQLKDILSRREFVVQNPIVVSRLIERAAQTKAGGLDDVLEEIESLRFRFWKPGIVKMALKARELRDR
ncbi:MAG TPA: hypothetical protein VH497_16575 [Vicinamibacterales bacterium]